jgi:hypothetical protein
MLIGSIACATLTIGVAAAARSQPALPLRLSAVAINMSNVGPAGPLRVELTIDRWSTEAERKGLITTFLEKGPRQLLDALQAVKPVGRIRTLDSVGWDLRFARQLALPDGGTQIIVVTDRPVQFWEARNQPRTVDYPFTLIDLRLKPDGTGEGKASVATKITYNKSSQTVELENYASEPVRLTNVKIENGK